MLPEALRFFNIKRKGIKIAPPGGNEIIFGIFSNRRTVSTDIATAASRRITSMHTVAVIYVEKD